ncbi:MAG: pseudouridine synthase [Leptolyngbyaceae bacterium]|nr:pseudouridine synthase [Leptolyngbyaceae bacterium]
MGDRHLLFYKPYGVLTQFSEERESSEQHERETNDKTTSEHEPSERLTLKNFIPVENVYPAGRLDRDSEGLLLLTSDGRLQHQLTDPTFAHPRTYWVQVERIPDDQALQNLRSGVTIKNYTTRPAQVTRLLEEPSVPPRTPPIRYRKSVPTAWLELTLTEGKNRQVRRMTAAVGFPTLRLIRVAIAHLRLDGLSPGQWRDITPDELQQFRRTGDRYTRNKRRSRQPKHFRRPV